MLMHARLLALMLVVPAWAQQPPVPPAGRAGAPPVTVAVMPAHWFSAYAASAPVAAPAGPTEETRAADANPGRGPPQRETTMRLITDAEIRSFDENGYVVCRGVLAPDELANFRAGSQRLVDEVLDGGPADRMCNRGPEGIPYYLNYLHANPNDFSLRLLAHPFIGDLLARMVGPDFIPCYESLVFKLPGHGSSVPWHRDGNARIADERIFNIDVYPDRSTVENSCVWVVPGSHVWPEKKAQEWVRRGRDEFSLPGAVPAEMEPGDVLLHHVKVLHGSTVNRSDELRRVVYFDSRAASWIDRYGWFSRAFVEKRCRLYQFAVHLRATHPYPSDDATFAYAPPPGLPTWSPGEPVDLHAPRDF